MEVKVLPKIADYWSSNPQLGCSWISSVMTRNRFMKINQFLQFTDQSRLIPRGRLGYNPISKILPILNYLKPKFAECFRPGQHVSVDEAMIGFKGRCILKQYLPSKPTKWGIKVWELCDSITGYCMDFNVYPGKNVRPSEHGLGFDVVTKLMHDYFGRFHKIYFDRFFNSVHLVEHLKANNTYACGTIMLNRRGLPRVARITKLRRGECRVYRKVNGTVLSTWRDKRQIAILSTCPTFGIDETGKPNIVQEYNMYMGGVDLNDQLCSYYKCGRASRKWWKYVMFFLLNISITNAWILWKLGDHDPTPRSTYSHEDFRIDIASFLRGGFTSRKITKGVVCTALPKAVLTVSGHNLVKRAGRTRQCRQCLVKGRRTPRGYKRETSYKCHICDVSLCKFPCFLEFHSVREAPEL